MADMDVFLVYDNTTIAEIFRVTLVGQDISPFDVQKLARVCKRFHTLLYSSLFIKSVFVEINMYGGSMAQEILKIGKTKAWMHFFWRTLQSAVVFRNMSILQKLKEAGFPLTYKGTHYITALFLCLKHNYTAGYRFLIESQVPVIWDLKQPTSLEWNDLTYDSPYFVAIAEGYVFPRINPVYQCVAYHSYDTLQLLAELHPKEFREVLSTKFKVGIGCDPNKIPPYLPYYGYHPERRRYRTEVARKTSKDYSLVSLEILRKDPSFFVIKFLISHGYNVTQEDRDVLHYKLAPATDAKTELYGCAMGTEEERKDLPQIQALFSTIS